MLKKIWTIILDFLKNGWKYILNISIVIIIVLLLIFFISYNIKKYNENKKHQQTQQERKDDKNLYDNIIDRFNSIFNKSKDK